MGQPITDPGMETFKCLIADDSVFARKHIGKIVSVIGGEVIGEAGNGNEAVEMYFRLKPDLVLMDITMPELDGVDALRKILEGDKNAKVIMISSIGHREMVYQAISLGAKHFVIKPYEPDYASMIIKSALHKKEGGSP
jgi:two-component system, chemotaxis family, chemotaxis protein CheY